MRHQTPQPKYSLEGPCPLCGAHVSAVPATTVDEVHPGYHVAGQPLKTKERETTVAACSGCEFVIDLHHPSGVPKTRAQLLAEAGAFVTEARR